MAPSGRPELAPPAAHAKGGAGHLKKTKAYKLPFVDIVPTGGKVVKMVGTQVPGQEQAIHKRIYVGLI